MGAFGWCDRPHPEGVVEQAGGAPRIASVLSKRTLAIPSGCTLCVNHPSAVDVSHRRFNRTGDGQER
jgi:hypothetical protein